jgi:hypothetical protein
MRTPTLLQLAPLLAAIQAVNAAPTPPASSGAPLRGSPDLAGYSPTNTVSNEHTESISVQYAPGQTDDAKIGAPLDFSNIAYPQPIRGTKGGTDPGPRECHKG